MREATRCADCAHPLKEATHKCFYLMKQWVKWERTGTTLNGWRVKTSDTPIDGYTETDVVAWTVVTDPNFGRPKEKTSLLRRIIRTIKKPLRT